MRQEFVHLELSDEIIAAGGHYVLIKEARLPFHGREVLYLVAHAAFDTACCGVSGCAYAVVPGFVLEWKGEKSADGLAVSWVEPLRTKTVQDQVRRLIVREEGVHQVVFL